MVLGLGGARRERQHLCPLETPTGGVRVPRRGSVGRNQGSNSGVGGRGGAGASGQGAISGPLC